MILQSLTLAIRNQNWFAVAVELLIVIIGVVIGFQVTAWNEARELRVLETRYMKRLEAAIGQDIEEFTKAAEMALERRGRAQLLVQAVSETEIADSQPTRLVRSALLAGWTYEPRLEVSVFQEMTATGNAGIILDEALRDSLASYYAQIENRAQWRYLREHIQRGYMDRSTGILTLEQQNRFWNEGEQVSYSVDQAHGVATRLRERPEFIEWLTYVDSEQIERAIAYRELGEIAEKLRDHLQQALRHKGH